MESTNHSIISISLQIGQIVIFSKSKQIIIIFSMNDFPRSCCLYHPSELITNFCTEKSCLMPLCPSCICTHGSTHPDGRPNLAHINDVMTVCYMEVQQMMACLQECKLGVNIINRKMIEEKCGWKETIEKTKQQVISIVQHYFEEFKKEIEAGADRQNKLLGLHVSERIDNVERIINQQLSQLIQIKHDLFNERALSTVITFYHQMKDNLLRQQVELQKQIKQNEVYSPVLILQPDAFSKMKNSLLQFFTLNFGNHQIKTQRQAIQSHLPITSVISSIAPSVMGSPMVTPLHSPRQSPIQSMHNSNRTSRVQINSPFKNVSNFTVTYPQPQFLVEFSKEQNSKLSKTSANNFYSTETRSPRSSLGIKLMAQHGGQSSRKKQISITKPKASC